MHQFTPDIHSINHLFFLDKHDINTDHIITPWLHYALDIMNFYECRINLILPTGTDNHISEGGMLKNFTDVI